MTPAIFKTVSEVQVKLNLKSSDNYTCRIVLIGISIYNQEMRRHLYVPYDEPLDFWRKSLIYLELTKR